MWSRHRRILTQISWLLVLATLVSCLRWDFGDFSLMPRSAPKAEAQSASQTTFYFKGHHSTAPIITANTYFGVAGPAVEYSSDTSGGTAPAGQTTALGMLPIAGPLIPATTAVNSGTGGSNSAVCKVWYRTFIMPLAAGMTFTNATTFQVGISAAESNAAANAYLGAFIYVYDTAAGNAATLAGPTYDTTEIGNNSTTNMGMLYSVTNAVATNYTTNSSDYLAVEIWVNFTAASTRTATIYWGGNTNVADVTSNSTPASRVVVGGTTIDTFDPLWFQSTLTDREPTPNAHQSGDTFQAGTWEGRRMATTVGTGAEAKSQALTITGNPYYYRMNSFTSPPLAAQTIPAANWILHMHGNEKASTDNAYCRYYIYVWKGDDSGIRGNIAVKANCQSAGTEREWGTTTTNNQVESVIAGASVAVTAGDRVVVEIEAVTKAATTTGPTIHRFGSDPTTPGTSVYDSSILPPMNYASTPTPLAYQTASYEQTNFRFDEDNDDETHDAWTDKNGPTDENDATVTYQAGTNFRLRVQIKNNGGETDILTPILYYRAKGPPAGDWTQVITTSDLKISASGQFSQGTVTTRQLTNQDIDFVAGKMIEDGTAFVGSTMTAWNFTEFEWSLQAGTSDTYEFKVTDDTVDFTTYPATLPAVTIVAPPAYTPNMNNWQWFADDEDVTPNTSYANEDSSPSGAEFGKGIPLKLRINLTETSGAGEDNSRKVLKWSTDQSTWTLVGEIGATGQHIRYFDGGGSDNGTLPSKLLSDSSAVSLGIHNESNSDSPSLSDHPASTTVEFEYCIQIGESATVNTTYYFQLYDQVLAAAIPLGSGKSYPSFGTAAAFDLSVAGPSDIAIGNFTLGGASPHVHEFIAAEKLTMRDNRGASGDGWTCSADITTLTAGSYTILESSIYWVSPTTSVTPLYDAPVTGMSGNTGEYMNGAVTVTSFSASGNTGHGGFEVLPEIRIYNMQYAGDYTGNLVFTII